MPENTSQEKDNSNIQISSSFALHDALIRGDIERAKRLIQSGVNVNEKGSVGLMALHIAVGINSEDMVK